MLGAELKMDEYCHKILIHYMISEQVIVHASTLLPCMTLTRFFCRQSKLPLLQRLTILHRIDGIAPWVALSGKLKWLQRSAGI